MMEEVNLDLHGVTVRLRSSAPGVLGALAGDFEYFKAARPAGPPRVAWDLRVEPPPSLRLGRALFRTRSFAAHDRGRTRVVRYGDAALARYDFALGAGELYCADPERLHELAYLAVLSRVGEELDRRGLHRVHALGFEFRGAAGLLLLASGGGKSTMALEMARSSDLGIVGEESPLVTAEGRVLAFPLRWGFRPSADLEGVPPALVRPFRRRRHGLKLLVGVDFFRARVRSDLPLRWLLIGRRRGESPAIRPMARLASCAALAAGLVVGHGLAQMAEYMLRPSPEDVLGLGKIALARARTALSLLRRAQPQRFTLGSDPKANLKVLTAFLERTP